MKDKKFLVLCGLGLVWLAIFGSMLFGAKIHPRVEQLLTVLCIAWFAFWTLSAIRNLRNKPQPKKEVNNATTTETNGDE